MRGFLVLGLVTIAVATLTPAANAQAEVVNTAFESIELQAFPGDEIDIGTGSYADLKFNFCYEPGGLAAPNDNQVEVKLSVVAAPAWGTASFVQDTYKFTIDNTKAGAKQCLAPQPPPQIYMQVPADMEGGESGQIDISIVGAAKGTLKKPADAAASVPVMVAMPDQDIISDLNANSSAETDPVEAVGAEAADSPGFDAVFVAVLGLAVLVAAAGRRRK